MRWLVLTVALTALAVPTEAFAADEVIVGTVRRVDMDTGTITVAPAKGEAKTYDVLKKAKVTVNEKSATLKDVGVGQSVTLTYNPQLEAGA